MFRLFWHKLTSTTIGGAVTIAFFSIVSKILGLLRDRLLASYFGAGSLLDSYYTAFKLPDFIFNTLVLGALASAFIPVFIKLWQADKERALILANSLLNWLLVFIIVLSAAVFFLAPHLMAYLAPGFSPEQLLQTITLTRIMLLSIIFFTVSNVVGSVLNSLRRFFTFSLAPLFYNLGIIMGIAVGYPFWGIKGLAWGVVFGSLLHLLIQLPEALRLGWRYLFKWQISSEVKKVLKLMVPRTLGLIGSQVNQLVITSVASTLTVGSIAVFNLANNLQSFPASIFGISLAMASFPVLSEALARKDHGDFIQTFSANFRRILFLIVPLSIFILLLRAQLVRVILGFGNFDWQDTYYTAQTLGWFVVSLFAQSLLPLLARTFYALEDTKTPVIISLVAIVLNIIGSLVLGRIFGVEGLAMAFSGAAIVNMMLLLLILRWRLGNLGDQQIILSLFKISLNSILAGGTVYLTLQIMSAVVNMRTFIGIFAQGLAAGLVGLLVYFILSLLTNCQEIIIVKRFLERYWRPLIK